MSHFASIQTQIRDMKALGSACSELGLELVPDTEARGFGQNTRRGDFVIRLRGPYDIALNRQDEGTYVSSVYSVSFFALCAAFAV